MSRTRVERLAYKARERSADNATPKRPLRASRVRALSGHERTRPAYEAERYESSDQ